MKETATTGAGTKVLSSLPTCAAKAAKINIFCQVAVHKRSLFSDFSKVSMAFGEHFVAFIDKHLSASEDFRL
jgi:hypothetical protein